MENDERAEDFELIEEVFEAVIDDLRMAETRGTESRADGAIAALRLRSHPAFEKVASKPVWPPVVLGARR